MSYASYTFSVSDIEYEDCGIISIPYESIGSNYICENSIAGNCYTDIKISFEFRDGIGNSIEAINMLEYDITTLDTYYSIDESGIHYIVLSNLPTGLTELTTYEVVASIYLAGGIEEAGSPLYTILCYAGQTFPFYSSTCEQSLGFFTYTPQAPDFSWQQDYSMVYNTQTQTWENQKQLSGYFTNSSTTNGSVSYFWESNDGPFSSSGTSGAITFPNCTEYTLTIESLVSGCTAASTQTIDLSDAAQCGPGGGGNNSNRLGNNESLQLFVDPISGVNGNPLLIKYESSNEQRVEVRIVGLDGKVIWQNNERSSQGMNHLKIPTSSFAKGMYLIQLYDQHEFITKKWLAQ